MLLPMAIRAVRAAKDYQEATLCFTKQLDKFACDPGGSSDDYVLQTFFPLLNNVVCEVLSARPDNPSTFLALWLLRQCGVPPWCINPLEGWLAGNEVGNPLTGTSPLQTERDKEVDPGLSQSAPSSAPTTVMEVTPPPKARTSTGGNAGPAQSPKTKRLCLLQKQPKSSAETVAGGAGEPHANEPASRGAEESHANEFDSSHRQGASIASLADAGEVHVESSEREQADEPLSPTCIHRRACRSRSNGAGFAGMGLTPADVANMLRKVPTLSKFNDVDLNKVSELVKCVKFEPGETVCHIGLDPKALYIVMDGVATVAEPQIIGRKGRGDIFGEVMLKQQESCSIQQVTANADGLTCLKVDTAEYNRLNIRRRLKKVGTLKTGKWIGFRGEPNGESGGQDDDAAQDVDDSDVCKHTGFKIDQSHTVTQFDRDMIANALMNNKVLSELIHFTEEQFDTIARAMHLVRVAPGEVITRAGDRGTCMYVIQDGLVDAFLGEQQGHVPFKIRHAESFGELALLYDTPRAATTIANRDTSLWVLTRGLFLRVAQMTYQASIDKNYSQLNRVPAFARIREEGKLHMLAGALEEGYFVNHDEIILQGLDAGLFSILTEGVCEVLEDGNRVRMLMAGDWYGDDDLVKNAPAKHTVRVVSDVAKALSLDHGAWVVLDSAMCDKGTSSSDPMDRELMTQCATEILKRRVQRKGSMASRKNSRSSLGGLHAGLAGMHDITLERLTRVGALGEGAFGSVLLMQDRETERRLALKVIFKEQIAAEGLDNRVANERTMMMLLDSDFVVRLYRTFEDDKHYFFIQEALLGGELFNIFDSFNLFGQVAHATFYMSCVILGLEHMHDKRIIYRDLKLENCLLDESGYLKLTDFGIAKLVIGRTYTVCGTTDYFAPETLKQTGHNRAVDWWACGVLLYIMLTGHSPFDAPVVTQTYKNILKGFSKVAYPEDFPRDAKDVIMDMCRKVPEERVPMQKGGLEKVKAMGFFRELDWGALKRHEVPPPFTPGRDALDAAPAAQLSRHVVFDPAEATLWDS